MERRQHHVADQRFLEGHDQGDLIPPLLHVHAEKLGIGDALHQRPKIQPAAGASHFAQKLHSAPSEAEPESEPNPGGAARLAPSMNVATELATVRSSEAW